MNQALSILVLLISIVAVLAVAVLIFRFTQRTEIRRINRAVDSMGWREVSISPAGFQPKHGFYFFPQHSYFISYLDPQGAPQLSKCTCSLTKGPIWES